MVKNNFKTLKQWEKNSTNIQKFGVPLQKGAWFSFLMRDSRGFLFGGSIYPWEHYNPVLSDTMIFNMSTSCYLIRKTLKTYIFNLKTPSSGQNK